MLTRDTIALAFYEYAVTLDDEYTYFWLHRTSTKTTWVVLLARYAMLVSVMLQILVVTSQVSETVCDTHAWYITVEDIAVYRPWHN